MPARSRMSLLRRETSPVDLIVRDVRAIAMPAAYVALLRGINVGGNNKLPMKDLVGIFAESDCENPRSYIQSGNVLFDASPGVAAGVSGRVAARIADRFGYRTPVILRTAAELATVLAHNPFLAEGIAEEELHVYFLEDRPDPPRALQLDPDRSPPDRFAVLGREVFLRLPNGMARTKLTNAYFDSKLATTSTARNWRTIAKLVELMSR
jgi:uncharacterized protein (DUF1697 family)